MYEKALSWCTRSVTNGKLTNAKKITLSRDMVSVFWTKCRHNREATSFKAHACLNRRERSALAKEMYLFETDEDKHKSTKLSTDTELKTQQFLTTAPSITWFLL
jgi:hypothetical protein